VEAKIAAAAVAALVVSEVEIVAAAAAARGVITYIPNGNDMDVGFVKQL
jgi:hypothetical protein